MIALGSLEKPGNTSAISSALPCRRRPRGNYMTKCSSSTLIGSIQARSGVQWVRLAKRVGEVSLARTEGGNAMRHMPAEVTSEQERVANELNRQVALRTSQLAAANEERKRSESLLNAEKRTLEMIANGASLTEILNDMCAAIDAHAPAATSMVCLMDVRVVAATNRDLSAAV